MVTRCVLLMCAVVLVLSPADLCAQEWRIHTVQRGENLTVIARRYDVTVDELRDWNSLRRDDLAIGQQLRIPGEDEEFTTVRSGDTLIRIASRHDTTADLLRSLNDLRRLQYRP